MTEPAKSYLWDTNGTLIADPGAGKRTDGYAAHALGPADEYNWVEMMRGEWDRWCHYRTKVWGTIWEALAESTITVGDYFRHRLDQAPWTSVDTKKVAQPGGGPLAVRLLATDGDHFCWVHLADTDELYLDSLSVPGVSVHWTPLLAAAPTSVAMDGITIWVTEGTNIKSYDYTGALLGSSAYTGTVVDVSQGYALTKSVAPGRYAHLWDSACTLIATFDSGAAGEFQCGRLTEHLTGGKPNALIFWDDGAMGGPLSVSMRKGTDLTQIWNLTTAELVTAKACWLTDHGTVRWAQEGGMNCLARELAYDNTTAPVALPTGFVIGGAVTYELYCASARFLLCWNSGVGMRVLQWDGTDCGEIMLTGLCGLACDGANFLARYDDFAAWDYVRILSAGRHEHKMRRYNPTSWKPICSALAVEDY